MADADAPVVDAGLEALDAFLSSERSPPDSMMLSDLDGFLTAIAIGPEPVMPSEWLPVIWGGEEPVFADEAEMQSVLGGIMSRYHQILHDVADGSFEPVLWTTSDGTLIASDWAEGFATGAAMRPRAWERLFRARRGADLILPIVALCGDENGDPLLEIEPGDEDRLMAEAAEMLPGCVIAIADYWHRARPRSEPRAARKPGRNDPCPCGSGRKYKRCCGKQA